MKSTEHVIFKRSYKKTKIQIGSQIRMLFFLLGILSLFVISEKFSFFTSLIKPIGVEKVFAVQDIKDSSFLLSPTPVLPEDKSTPSALPLFDVNSLTAATPTPTLEPKQVLAVEAQNDFCLNVPILLYHHVQPLDEARALGHAQLTVDSGIFDEQMAYLVAQGYTTISSDQVVSALLAHQQLPQKSIVVTLDDGYDDAYNYSFPIAKKYNINLDWMVPSGLLNNPGYMTWDQLKDASQNSLIHIYNHSWSHAALGDVDNAKLDQEVVLSNQQLESGLGKKISVFTYPYGTFSTSTINYLKEHGFVGGISTINGTQQCESFIMTLHRTHIGNAPLSSYGF